MQFDESPLISIIIPVFNREELIAHTLKSIIEQDYENWECILVDDGSTDNTKAIIQGTIDKDARFSLYDRPRNRPKGANACRNYGLELSTGVFVNWFDSDDVMLPSKLSTQLTLLVNSEYHFAICQTERFDLSTNESFGLRCENIVSNDTLNDYIQFKIFWVTGTPLWKKEFLVENGFSFNEKLHQSQDYDYHINILAKYPEYAVTSKALMLLVRHSSNMSNNLYDTNLKLISNIRARYDALKNHSKRLNVEAKGYLFDSLFKFFKNAIPNTDFLTGLKIYRMLVLSLQYLDISLSKRIRLFMRWGAAFLGHYFLNKGERFLKPYNR